ncbi:NADH dehydrogenase 1 alpha subcomplex assembly factor 3 [Ilyonectria robusta]|uniref:NADH dehydrogenase 1 alpha subcomplex assembly factor 3 n=1 Tax=Ilyonectria robusta TaxID=1079257 RepID=UPI001E8EA194|nr:NADH dehydrogenase 1 alpha subcomplex assembly factor 3 [Ilyonectria robusta]KAH8672372.1 NADH dehydrogenase 1 alpha subcomplex assembly factor 3 [Ilyonectria robusta]
MATMQSPEISSVAWGHMEIAGLEPGKDFKLYPGGGRPWDWGETGMRHKPGICVVDVEELLQKGATTIVLSQGMDLKLQIDPATLSYLEGKGVTVHVAETRKAVEIYNSLAKTTAIGGLFHSTC